MASIAASVTSQYSNQSSNDIKLRIIISAHGIVIDDAGLSIPQDVEAIINTHIPPAATPLTADEYTLIQRTILNLWDNKDAFVLRSLVQPPLFPSLDQILKSGHDTAWSKEPTPQQENQAEMPASKAAIHVGFMTGLHCRRLDAITQLWSLVIKS
ncbi:hypothetical protein N7495_005029 [Penicillium taxi]|uniref:uncharacterized protein n=1 Tax=Penicillium taxi TaxID=168475 RepID=UPI00254598A0|nr:uncharacterized protein N7495_005029 [Penicillium taxi]KAJ5893338.1 hypothetical protein N7495_005029 [Penicillium taxi]